jgi:hypothetical protein
MKAYVGEDVQPQPFLSSELDGREWPTFVPQPFYAQERTPEVTEQEAGWAAKQVSMVWRKQRFLAPTRIRALDHPARS